MPFLGVALSKKGLREIQKREILTFASQRLLLTAIYRSWDRRTLTEAANDLGMSKMSITRSFDEIQALGLDLIISERKMRRFIWTYGRRALWERVEPFLRNPVARQFNLSERAELFNAKLGGMSALCHYTMLADNPYPVFAVSRGVSKGLALERLSLLPNEEIPAMIVQVLGYDIEYQDGAAIDPLTAILSLSEEEKNDYRVEAAIETVLEECLHD